MAEGHMGPRRATPFPVSVPHLDGKLKYIYNTIVRWNVPPDIF